MASHATTHASTIAAPEHDFAGRTNGMATTRRPSRNVWAERAAHALPYVLFVAAMLLLDSIGRAATQEEFFKSVQQSVGNSGPGDTGEITGRGFAAFLGIVGMTIAALVLAQKLYRRLSTRTMASAPTLSGPTRINQPRKLAKEIAKVAGLSGDELRQLKAVADQYGYANPLTLLICPSLLIEATQRSDTNADHAVLARIARRIISS